MIVHDNGGNDAEYAKIQMVTLALKNVDIFTNSN